MAARALRIACSLLGDAYHGEVDWPPSPFRLFQALVAGAYGGRWRSEPAESKDAAMRWLETLDAPWMGAPEIEGGSTTTFYVPNNDLDTKRGDPREVSNIRVAKQVTPRRLRSAAPIVYAWPFEGAENHAQKLCELSERLHTLGRGVDGAFACASITDWSEAEAFIRDQPIVARPSSRPASSSDPTCPTRGSFDSLVTRYEATLSRLREEGREVLFRQPPKATFRTVSYAPEPDRLLVELRGWRGGYRGVPQERASDVAKQVRALLVHRLASGSDDVALARALSAPRFRILPLPTIGHEHASSAIRRVLVEMLPNREVGLDDITWALNGQILEGLTEHDEETGEVWDTQLVVSPAEGDPMLGHYGLGKAARRWRTVTPVVVSIPRVPGRVGGRTRAQSEARVAVIVADDVRAAGLPTAGLIVHVQKEPFHGKGAVAGDFLRDPSARRQPVHAEIVFEHPVAGPLAIGSGVGEGLGVFRPVDVKDSRVQSDTTPSAGWFRLLRGPSIKEAVVVGSVMRAALMSQMGDHCPSEISGRNDDGPLGGHHEHAFFLPEDVDGDGLIDHVLVYRSAPFKPATVRAFRALTDLFCAGHDGQSRRWPVQLESVGPLDSVLESKALRRSPVWTSSTPFLKSRFDKRSPRTFGEVVESYRRQFEWEWRRRFLLPVPRIEAVGSDRAFALAGGEAPEDFVLSRAGRGGREIDRSGAFLKLTFERPVQGPFALGKHAHFGLGLFMPG